MSDDVGSASPRRSPTRSSGIHRPVRARACPSTSETGNRSSMSRQTVLRSSSWRGRKARRPHVRNRSEPAAPRRSSTSAPGGRASSSPRSTTRGEIWPDHADAPSRHCRSGRSTLVSTTASGARRGRRADSGRASSRPASPTSPTRSRSEECDEIVDGDRVARATHHGRSSAGRAAGATRRDSARRARARRGGSPPEFLALDDLADDAVTDVSAPSSRPITVVRPTSILVGPPTWKTWWNGEQVPHTRRRYTRQTRVHVERSRQRARVPASPRSGTDRACGTTIGCDPGSRCTRPTASTERPEFVTWGVAPILMGDGTAHLQRRDSPPARRRRLGAGSWSVPPGRRRSGLGDTVIARQAKVEYYESERGSTPAFFSHDVTDAVRRRPREIVVELEGAAPHDVAWVDLVVFLRDGQLVRVRERRLMVGDVRGESPRRARRQPLLRPARGALRDVASAPAPGGALAARESLTGQRGTSTSTRATARFRRSSTIASSCRPGPEAWTSA